MGNIRNSINSEHSNPGRSSTSFNAWGIMIVIVVVIMVASLLLFIIIGYISEKKRSSYLPAFTRGSRLKLSEDYQARVLNNQWYKLRVSNSGSVQVENMNGEIILAELIYYYEYDDEQNGNFLQNTSVIICNDSVVTIRGWADNDVDVSISLTVCQSRPKMNVEVNTSYKSHKTVYRESLVALFKSRVSEVYLKNSEIDRRPLAKEYWVDKHGVKFGEGDISALIYHTPDVSSVQVQRQNNLLYVNLDYVKDHPFIRIPFQEDGEGKWIDISASKYKPGDEKVNKFALHFGFVPEVLPRLMPVPGGYLAGYIFTEHADKGNLRTHRAAYFGSESIICSEDAVGGFCGHQIPVTKSVFFDEFDDGLNCQADSSDNEREYLAFLDQIYALGSELCLHTPEAGNSTRNIMEESMKFMEKRYNSRSWIDHGMYTGNTNREAFSADGLDPSSSYYAADLWEKYNINYFWSPAVEALRFSSPEPSLKRSLMKFKPKEFFTELCSRYSFLKIYGDNNLFERLFRIIHGNLPMLELNSQRPFMGDAFPTPLFWQNPTYSKQFYSWTTEFVYYGVTRHMDSANMISEQRQLDKLIKNRGIFFNHGYFVRNAESDDILYLHDGRLTINPYFDTLLMYMDNKRDNGNLLLTTVRDFLDYRLQIENIVFDYKPDGSIDIMNKNQFEVKELALAIKTDADNINLKGTKFCSKKDKYDTIIWFNMPAETSVNLTISKREMNEDKCLLQSQTS